MKSILIITGSLMTVATVYGIVDYSKKSGSKEFKELYTQQPVANEAEKITEEKKVVPAITPIVETNKTTIEKKPEVKKNLKKKKSSRKLTTKAFSRSKLG